MTVKEERERVSERSKKNNKRTKREKKEAEEAEEEGGGEGTLELNANTLTYSFIRRQTNGIPKPRLSECEREAVYGRSRAGPYARAHKQKTKAKRKSRKVISMRHLASVRICIGRKNEMK